jgi:hypothetical protein
MVSQRLRHRAWTRPRGNPSTIVFHLLPPICQFAGIRAGSAMRRQVLPGRDLICRHQRFLVLRAGWRLGSGG